jgi:hypothetical protein
MVTMAFLVTVNHRAQAACTVPNTLTNGQTADATQVMANFTSVTNCINSAPAGSTNALQYNAGTGTFGGVGPLTNGQIAIGSTGNAPQASQLTAGTGITITNGPGSITISAGATPTAGPGGPPQGRLTLTSGVPVMSADVVGATSIYYTPYQGNAVPIWNGTAWVTSAFTQLTMAMSTTAHLSGNLYDLFIYNTGSSLAIGAGPAWVSTTTRGSGAGSTQIDQSTGLWTNTNSITLTNGSGTATVGANEATYVGTFYATANGQTTMQFAPAPQNGGTNNVLGVYNAYNRVEIGSVNQDNTGGTWSYSGSWRPSNGSTSNRINWIDGLGQSSIDATATAFFKSYASGGGNGIAEDNTTSPGSATMAWLTSSGQGQSLVARDLFPPQIGLHYAQSVEGTNPHFSRNIGASGVGI